MRGAQQARRNGRGIELVRGCWGLTLLFAPAEVLERLHGNKIDPRALRVTRVLGARHLSQALLSGLRPSPEVLAMGAWVDVAHSATAVGLAVTDPGRGRLAWTDAGVAGVWGALGVAGLASARATAPAHERRRDAMARWTLRRVPGGGPLLRRVDRERARR